MAAEEVRGARSSRTLVSMAVAVAMALVEQAREAAAQGTRVHFRVEEEQVLVLGEALRAPAAGVKVALARAVT